MSEGHAGRTPPDLGEQIVDTSTIKSLKPVDPVQGTKAYGERQPFAAWEDPKRPGRKLGGYMQQVFCQYETNTGERVWGEFWDPVYHGIANRQALVAPGYELEEGPDRTIRVKVGEAQPDQFSQFFKVRGSGK